MNSRLVIKLRGDSRRVLCDTDLNAKPLIPRRYEPVVSAIVGGLLLMVLTVALAIVGRL